MNRDEQLRKLLTKRREFITRDNVCSEFANRYTDPGIK
jgi:hypothetical protein